MVAPPILDKAEIGIHSSGCGSVIAAQQCKRSPFKQHLAALTPGPWTQIDHPVGMTDEVQIMLYDDTSEAFRAELQLSKKGVFSSQ